MSELKRILLSWDDRADWVGVDTTMWASGRAMILMLVPGETEYPRELTLLPDEARELAHALLEAARQQPGGAS